jgi:PadR family transcriptional regulator PadR
MKKSDHFDNWTVQVRKGVLELCVLNALEGDGERYGYELVKSLVAMPGLGVTEGTIYPLLSRLRVQGFVTTRLEESSEGPARKYYALTPAGKQAAKLMNEHIDLLVEGSKMLRGQGGKQ